MLLYHAGFEEIPAPDVHYGRKNADFGQGFYLTADAEFARRWAKERPGRSTVINTYEFNPEGLRVKRFERDADWFAYIFDNRRGKKDALDADVVIGPIANDTIYDTFGILTSGFVPADTALRLLQVGPEYVQIALKTEAAAKNLTWLSAARLDGEALKQNRAILAEEQEAYQKQIGELLRKEM